MSVLSISHLGKGLKRLHCLLLDKPRWCFVAITLNLVWEACAYIELTHELLVLFLKVAENLRRRALDLPRGHGLLLLAFVCRVVVSTQNARFHQVLLT